ncbi:HAD-IIIA family hydrolase [Psychromonas algicola]|uniref:HAD-IIIA family hydrolase n=1 Tax=Psychromonas algicola TaxID=2555642 RepID=UPI0010680C20|nr:HAD-IIIA family hydrolase [Psychromonas sp. RZ5]TEW43771.1 HAD-IIIA family hydrolase [Psychromonas sp. RZ5]
MKYKLIIFDWDGTLMDSIDKIVLCMQQAAKQQQQVVASKQSVKGIIGLSLLKAVQQLYPLLGLSEQQALVEAYRQQYNLNQHIETPLYPDIKKLLVNLKSQGYTLAVATGKGRNGLNKMLEKSATSKLFSATICADEAHSKPDPLMLNLLLEKLGIEASQALMVGDSSYDLEMAKNAGMDSLGVSYGVHDANQLSLYDPVAIVDDLTTELQQYI